MALSLSALQLAHVERQEEWCPDQNEDTGDEEACVVCGEHLEKGDAVYWSCNDDGHMHADCATSYVDEDGKETDAPPEPFAFRSDRYTPSEGGTNG